MDRERRSKKQTRDVASIRKLVLHGIVEAGEVLDLRAEDEVSELGEREENDEEHDGKSGEIFGAGSER